MNILGISCFYHDSAACLVRDGKIIAAAQEERFTRRKHDERFPEHAIQYCLDAGGITAHDIDIIAFYDTPFLKLERMLETYMSYAPRGLMSFLTALPGWFREKFWVEQVIRRTLGYQGKVIFLEHHESHAASAFFPSPFQDAAFLTVDGVGEWATASFGVGHDNHIEMHGAINFPHSLGLLYSALTYYTGFKVNSGEYKVMGLAPYGEPRYVDRIKKHLIEVKSDGSFRLNMDYFDFAHGLTMTNDKFHALFGGPPREPETALTQKEMDIARSLQVVTEDVMLHLARHVHAQTHQKYLCLAGGVALNCVANGRLLREGPFDDIWIQPAAGDAGGALGAALYAWYHHANNPRHVSDGHDAQQGSFLGPAFDEVIIKKFLDERALPYRYLSDEVLFPEVAKMLADEKVIGWFQGRMEFGPRALGARSIIGDARSTKMQALMNLKIKFREGFRPFAPSILAEHVGEYFEIDRPSPYMLLTAYVQPSHRRALTQGEQDLWGIAKLNTIRSDIPAVTHIDYSARLQTVHRDTNPRYHRLIEEFYHLTNCPVVVNTSFNVRGEPIVCTPEDAYRCFMRTHLDYLVLGNYVLTKTDQPQAPDESHWQQEYVLD